MSRYTAGFEDPRETMGDSASSGDEERWPPSSCSPVPRRHESGRPTDRARTSLRAPAEGVTYGSRGWYTRDRVDGRKTKVQSSAEACLGGCMGQRMAWSSWVALRRPISWQHPNEARRVPEHEEAEEDAVELQGSKRGERKREAEASAGSAGAWRKVFGRRSSPDSGGNGGG
ncbi:hypothetical protein MRX96_023738 [Rhipicephalus microplus]